MAAAVPSWDTFKAAFLDPFGRIVDNGNDGISHSEGQGYGLLLAVWNDDRATFDRLLDWTERTLARRDVALFSWRYDPKLPLPVGDPNNATDGDILIAWALAHAARRWEDDNYDARSRQIRAAILAQLVVEHYGRHLLLPGMQGFVSGEAVTLNPSYFIWPALDEFRVLDGAAWEPVIADGEALLGAARFGPLSLPTDWIDVSGRDAVAPALGRPARFGFDAVRVALYGAAGHREALVAPIRAFWSDYAARHQPIPAWVDVRSGETANFPLSPGGDAIVRKLLGGTGGEPLAPDYYAAVLQLLVQFL